MRVDVYREARGTSGGGGGGGVTALPLTLRSAFIRGGSIYQFTVYSDVTGLVSYAPAAGTSAKDDGPCALVIAPEAGLTVPVLVEYQADADCLLTVTERSAAGSWSYSQTVSLPANEGEISAVPFSVVLAGDEGFGLHIAPTGGASVVTYEFLRIYF